jgi:hypothetical protein
MDQLLVSATVAIAALAGFLLFITALKYGIPDAFVRTRLIMTAFVAFIIVSLTAAFWRYTADSLVYSVPALLLGMLAGHEVGVKAAQEKLAMQGVRNYMEHVAHVHIADVSNLQWWSVINFYSIAGALLVINLLGASVVFFDGRKVWALITCAVGAFLVGTLVPYLMHLWKLSRSSSAA